MSHGQISTMFRTKANSSLPGFRVTIKRPNQASKSSALLEESRYMTDTTLIPGFLEGKANRDI